MREPFSSERLLPGLRTRRAWASCQRQLCERPLPHFSRALRLKAPALKKPSRSSLVCCQVGGHGSSEFCICLAVNSVQDGQWPGPGRPVDCQCLLEALRRAVFILGSWLMRGVRMSRRDGLSGSSFAVLVGAAPHASKHESKQKSKAGCL